MVRITSIMFVWADGSRSNLRAEQEVRDVEDFKRKLKEKAEDAERIWLTYEEVDDGENKDRIRQDL